MSAVNERLVRAYLEGLGFLVRMPRRYQVIARARRPEEEIDLLGLHPHPASGGMPAPGVWTGIELRRARAVLVAVCGWHTETFTPAVIEQAPELFRFLEPDAVAAAERALGGGPVARVFVLPGLSADARLRDDALAALRDRGVDGVVSFRTVLLELAGMADEQRHYDRSDLMQVLRLMKIYDLFKSPQQELFRPRARTERPARRARAARAKNAETPPPADGDASGDAT
jgi:hypothetical protein